MIRSLYSLLASGAQPLLRRKLRRRGQAEPGYLQAVEERFGRYSGNAQPGALWIHAVSLGETRAAAILIERLRSLKPDLRILLTHGTATGRAEGERLLRDGDRQAWLPWDTPKAVRRFLDHFQPSAGVLMETEVWPNLVAVSRKRGLPLVLANARLSEKSLAKAQRLARLSRPAYASLTAVWAQTEDDAQRLAQAGATVKGVFGNLKFDAPHRCGAARARTPVACRNRQVRGDVRQLARRRGGRVLPRPESQPRTGASGLGAAFDRPDRPARAVAGGAAAPAALRRGGGACRAARPDGVAPQPVDGAAAGRRCLDRRLAGRDGAVLRPGRRRPAGRQFRPAGRAEPDRGGRLRLPGGDGPAHLQFRRSGAARAGGGGGGAGAEHGRSRAQRGRAGRQRDAASRRACKRPAAFCAAHQGAAQKTAEAVLALLAR